MNIIPTDVDAVIEHSQCSLGVGIHRRRAVGIIQPHPKSIRTALLFTLVVFGMTPSQVKSGTIVIVGYSKQRLFVVADSRDRGNKETSDDYCKISALSDKVLFASTGYGGTNWHVPWLYSWTNNGEARRAFSAARESPGSGNVMREAADRWGGIIRADIDQLIVLHPDVLLNNTDSDGVNQGIFAGATAYGALSAFVAVVFYDRRSLLSKMPTRTWCTLRELQPSDDPGSLHGFGRTSVFNEFMTAQTPRAKIEAARWAKQNAGKGIPNLKLLLAIHMVELTEAYPPPENDVGGPIDAAELIAGGRVHWVQRKANCPEN